MEEISLKNENGKWKLSFKDNNQTFDFYVNEMKNGEIFDETKIVKANVGVPIDAKLKVAKTDLSYANYGLLEMTLDYQGQKVTVFNPFVLHQKDKKVPFIKPAQDLRFSGTTNAVLTTRKNNKFSYKDIIGTANMTVSANQPKANINFTYNTDDFKTTMTVKNVDLETGKASSHDDFKFSNKDYHLMDDTSDNKTYLDHTMLDNKEMVGSYRARFQQFKKENNQNIGIGYTLDGVFGMKKQ